MACMDGANPVWAVANFSAYAGGNAAQIYSPEQADSFAAGLVGLAGCDDARMYIESGLFPLAPVGQTGAVINPPDQAQTIAAGNSITATFDGVNVGSAVYNPDDGTFTSDIPAGIIGVNILQSASYTGVSSSPVMSTTLATTFDFDLWWCCATAAFNCCGSPPVGTPTNHFLIPRPPTLEPGQQQFTVPPLFTPLYLSNYTFQFTNNFGRVK